MYRDIEDLLAERGIIVTRESIRLWCIKFGVIFSRRLKRKHRGYGDTVYIDEVFVKINGKQHYLWGAVDQDAEVVDVYLQARMPGLFVSAEIVYKNLDNVLVLPREALVRRKYIYTLDENNTITESAVTVLKKDLEQVWLQSGIRDDTLIIVPCAYLAGHGIGDASRRMARPA